MRLAEMVTFGGSGLDRSAHFRGDDARIAALLAQGVVLPLWHGKPLIHDDRSLAWVRSDSPVLAFGRQPMFLGLDDDGPRFACDISDWSPEAGAGAIVDTFLDPTAQRHPALSDAFAFLELRSVMTWLSPREAELAVSAKAVLQWHRSHGFCAACGAATTPAQAGWQRNCPACGAHHFPRTDPVVIMLVTHGNRALIGRSPGWPEGMYSCLAGFVEPGEGFEGAVRREVLEETGIHIGAVRYLASQPWPFPASLMIGCEAQAFDDAITLDPVELEDAIWISRDDMVAVMAGAHPQIKPARRGAIAHFLIAQWLADRLD